MQQPEAKTRQGGEENNGQGWSVARGKAVTVVLAAAGGVVDQAQLVVGLVDGLTTGFFRCTTAQVRENPHLT